MIENKKIQKDIKKTYRSLIDKFYVMYNYKLLRLRFLRSLTALVKIYSICELMLRKSSFAQVAISCQRLGANRKIICFFCFSNYFL